MFYWLHSWGTGRASRHLIGPRRPHRPRPLEGAGWGRGSSPRIPDRARSAAERGAGCWPPAGTAAAEAGRACGAETAPRGQARGRRSRPAAPPGGSPGPRRRWPLRHSGRQRASLLLLRPGRAPRAAAGERHRRGEPVSCQAGDAAAQGRRETQRMRPGELL